MKPGARLQEDCCSYGGKGAVVSPEIETLTTGCFEALTRSCGKGAVVSPEIETQYRDDLGQGEQQWQGSDGLA